MAMAQRTKEKSPNWESFIEGIFIQEEKFKDLLSFCRRALSLLLGCAKEFFRWSALHSRISSRQPIWTKPIAGFGWKQLVSYNGNPNAVDGSATNHMLSSS